MKTRHCDECEHSTYLRAGSSVFSMMVHMRCAKGHKPRFYIPSLDPRDTDWGYKRKCADFAPITPQETK